MNRNGKRIEQNCLRWPSSVGHACTAALVGPRSRRQAGKGLCRGVGVLWRVSPELRAVSPAPLCYDVSGVGRRHVLPGRTVPRTPQIFTQFGEVGRGDVGLISGEKGAYPDSRFFNYNCYIVIGRINKYGFTDNMLALKTESEVAQELANRVRTIRLQLGWSQDELARRAGLRPATYRLFEQTGRIALLRLLKVLSVLDRLPDIDPVCALGDTPRSLDELLVPKRQRAGRAKHA